MKKILLMILILSLTVCALSSCVSRKNKWFSEEKLEKCFVPELPKVECSFLRQGSEIAVKFTEEEFNEYLGDVYGYLKSRNFKYLGTRGDLHSSLSGAFSTYYFKEAGTLEEFYVDGAYRFVYSDGESDGDGEVTFCIISIYNTGFSDTDTIEYSIGQAFDYNTKIRVSRSSEYPLNGDYTLKDEHTEHTGEWLPYNKSNHYYEYTCGCTLPEKIEKHVNNDGDECCDICGYSFTDGPVEVFFLGDFASWLSDLEAEDVAEIKTTFEYVGVAPGNLTDILRTTDKSVISDVLENYKYTSMTEIDREDTYVAGGSAFGIEFTLTDGTVKKLHFNNGNYAHGPNEENASSVRYFRLDSIPTLKGYESVTESKGFVAYGQTGKVYDGEDRLVCEISLDELEFVELAAGTGVGTVVTYIVETEYGNLLFASNQVFHIEGRESGHYQLVGNNLDELIAQYAND